MNPPSNTEFKMANERFVMSRTVLKQAFFTEGITHRIKLICPHMKCHLVFNQEEETWDCTCHGSRFDLDGNLLEGPAKEDLKNEQF